MIPKVINKQYVAGTPHLSLVSLTYLDKSGKEGTWVSAERPGNKNAVVIIALKNEPKNPMLVVTREFRVPIKGYEWGLPAGLIDERQSIEDTAVRELKEETGLDVVKFLRPVTPMVYNSPGLTNEAISYAFVEVSGQISNKFLKDSEDIATYLYPRASVQALLRDAMNPQSNIMVGAKAWLIFERFVKYGDV
jgi:8-oxo-dGTP pyrophosphatase MutT (NUDIX family)